MSIDPPDAEISETYVPKDGDPPGPAQAAFNGLIPGRAYNISVETVSEGQVMIVVHCFAAYITAFHTYLHHIKTFRY